MSGWLWRSLALGALALQTGCAAAPPAPALAGLWSVSPQACAAGLGVTFDAGAVRARFGGDKFTLLEQPRYAELRMPRASDPRVRIDYAMPDGLGRGQLVLQREGDQLSPVLHRVQHGPSGSARVALDPAQDPVGRAFQLRRCSTTAPRASA